MDFWIGELLRSLDQVFAPGETLVVFTADHGECFEDGIYFEHANCLSAASLRIPLLIRYPRDFVPGARRAEQASILDVLPTILRATGLEKDRDFSGRPLQDADGFGDRYLLVQHPHYQVRVEATIREERRQVQTVAGTPVQHQYRHPNRLGVIGSEWLYIRDKNSEDLFQSALGAGTFPDLAEEQSDVTRSMSKQLRAMLRTIKRRKPIDPDIDEDLANVLEALGYVN